MVHLKHVCWVPIHLSPWYFAKVVEILWLFFGKQKNAAGAPLKLEVQDTIRTEKEMAHIGVGWKSRESDMNQVFGSRKWFKRQRWREETGWGGYDSLRGQRWGNGWHFQQIPVELVWLWRNIVPDVFLFPSCFLCFTSTAYSFSSLALLENPHSSARVSLSVSDFECPFSHPLKHDSSLLSYPNTHPLCLIQGVVSICSGTVSLSSLLAPESGDHTSYFAFLLASRVPDTLPGLNKDLLNRLIIPYRKLYTSVWRFVLQYLVFW